MEININEDALRRMVEESPGFAKIQADANETLQGAIREVRDEMAGQPADEVLVALKARVAERVGMPIEFDEANMREIAESIEKGDLTD